MATELAPGASFAGYEVESLVGRGAMAEVYRARDAGGRVVALKLLDRELARDERFRQRFLREAELAAGIGDEHVVATLDAGDDGGRLYLVMAFVDGEDLRALLRREGRLAPERAVALVEQAAAGLDAAHAAGLVHRDVKPGNILVADGDRAYVCDFGLARHVSSVSSLTGDRGFVGTIDYVPPEQIEGRQIGAPADVYSLGCVLYECLAGMRPYDRDSELAVVFAHLNEPPPTVTSARPELPHAFDELFATALAKDPEDRYGSCGELARAARAALGGRVVRRRRFRRWAIAAAAAAVAALAAAALYVAFSGSGGAPAAVTITPAGIGPARLGDSSIALEKIWHGGGKATLDVPSGYALLRQPLYDVTAYFQGTDARAVELATWNKADRTAEGVGPCSSVAALKRAYGDRLVPAPGNTHDGIVDGYSVGRRLFFAMAPPQKPTFVQSVAVFSNALHTAGYLALGDGPCTGAVAQAPPRPAALPAVPLPPPLTHTLASTAFTPRLAVRAPAGWKVGADTEQLLVLRGPRGARVLAALDPRPVAAGAPVPGVLRTPIGLVTWLQHSAGVAVGPSATAQLGRPPLTTRVVAVSPRAAASYLVVGGAALHGAPSRLYLGQVRTDVKVRTLILAATAPAKAGLAAALPGVEAMLGTLRIRAHPVNELSSLSTFCTRVFYGSCLGELPGGTYATSTFAPKLTYTVPPGWTNYTDHPGVFGLVPPGYDWEVVDDGLADLISVASRVAAPRDACAGGASGVRTPDAFVAWLRDNPAFADAVARRVAIGGLAGWVVDVRIAASWTRSCLRRGGPPGSSVIIGLPPSPEGFAHGLDGRRPVMRLYLLRYRGGTLAIEVDDRTGGSHLAAYDRVVRSFRFAS
jgi:tRNA A-37 threonylcarbamoyl transferase component Bud32